MGIEFCFRCDMCPRVHYSEARYDDEVENSMHPKWRTLTINDGRQTDDSHFEIIICNDCLERLVEQHEFDLRTGAFYS